jgi:hypothetical protein
VALNPNPREKKLLLKEGIRYSSPRVLLLLTQLLSHIPRCKITNTTLEITWPNIITPCLMSPYPMGIIPVMEEARSQRDHGIVLSTME